MDNYVRRCVMYAVIGMIITLAVCIGASIHGRGKPVAVSDNADVTEPIMIQEVTPTKTLIRAAKRDDAKLPDEGRPSHANAVEPPTLAMMTLDGAIKVIDLPDMPAAKKEAKTSEIKASKPAEEVTEEAVTEVVVEMPEYAAEPDYETYQADVAEIFNAVSEVEKSLQLFYGSGRYASITLTDEENEALARLIYHECRGNGGQAVAETVFNRMLSGEFPNTLEGVIYMSGAFSPAMILWTHEYKELDALERCREIPREVLNGDTYYLPSTDYCYFHAGHATLEGDYEYGGNVFYADYAAHH